MTAHRSVERLGVAAALVDGVIVPGDDDGLEVRRTLVGGVEVVAR